MAGAVRTLHPVATVGFSSRTRGAYLSVETIGAGPLPFRKMNLDLQVTAARLPQAAQMGRVDLTGTKRAGALRALTINSGRGVLMPS